MALEESGKRQLLNMGVGNIGFDVHDPKVVNWLKDYSLKQAKLSVDTNREKLREILSNGFQEGLTETQIGEEIATEFSGYENWKAERIARTEINASANKGRIEAMRDAGVTKKFWLTARDERVRETHIEAERKYKDGIPLDEEFNVGKGSCVEPGNTGLAEEDINCRCSAEVYE
jgi:SPP1 gp7 family putative phage head morphogenesis protein